MSRKKTTRREFLRRTAGTAGAVFTLPYLIPSGVLGEQSPSNRIVLAVIGVGGQGQYNAKGFLTYGDAYLAAVCDVDKKHREEAKAIIDKHYGSKDCAMYGDYREVLARKDIDAVIICTPDHWHVPMETAAARAGKDIYGEKPLSLTIDEGRVLCDTVKETGCVFQTGSQQRSDDLFRQACELVINGRIGKLHTIKADIIKSNLPKGPEWEDMPVPEGFDYDFWLGPAPWATYTKNRCHYNFRFIRDYSGGQMTNWGAHFFDIAQWGNEADNSGPVEIEGTCRFPEGVLFNTADFVKLKYTYANGVTMHCTSGEAHTEFIGTEGSVWVTRGRLETKPTTLRQATIGPDEKHLYESKDHKRNFLDCVKLRKKPIADVEVGHRTATVCHLGNIAMLLGRKLQWDPQKELFVNDPEANRMKSYGMRSPWRL